MLFPRVIRDRVSVALDCSESEDLAKQEFKAESDINEVLRRFNVTGQLPQNVRKPEYGDFTGIGDFQQALAAIEQARDSFMEMPADIRRRFDNDPGAFVDFFADPTNIAEARRLGLVPAAELLDVSPGAPSSAPASSPSPAEPAGVSGA